MKATMLNLLNKCESRYKFLEDAKYLNASENGMKGHCNLLEETILNFENFPLKNIKPQKFSLKLTETLLTFLLQNCAIFSRYQNARHVTCALCKLFTPFQHWKISFSQEKCDKNFPHNFSIISRRTFVESGSL